LFVGFIFLYNAQTPANRGTTTTISTNKNESIVKGRKFVLVDVRNMGSEKGWGGRGVVRGTLNVVN
jgi:hypothetical protein